MTVVKGVIREIGPSRTTRVSARRWYGSSTIVVQSEETGQTYSVRVSAKTMDRCRFLPRVGMRIVVHGFVEEAEFGLSDFVVSRVTRIKREGSDVKRIYRFDED
ncbi:MAG: hypothetical protein AM324_007390 [Candidatus Thorarchaeota archaeon SMTZ1-83]|nr:MAG: hypothetical protein AM324_08615 [Candidatus Thorarchaeota archaeon SMTZ1-83]